MSNTAPRITWTADLDQRVTSEYLARGMDAARIMVELTGRPMPEVSQLERCIARHTFNISYGTPSDGMLAHVPAASKAIIRRMQRNRGLLPATARTRRQTAAAPTATFPDPLTVRCIGVEVEFHRGRGSYRQRGEITDDLNDRGIPSYNLDRYDVSHTESTRTGKWIMKTDGTVTGGEIVSPILPGDGASLTATREVIRAVKASGARTGKGVGMHIHHDVRDFEQYDMMTLATNLRKVEDAMAAYLPTARSGRAQYGAQKLYSSEWDRIITNIDSGALLPDNARHSTHNRSGSGVSRYRFFNFSSVLTYGSVEFRALGNTLNPVKVRAWIEVGQALMGFSKYGLTFDGVQSPASMIAELTQQGFLAGHAAETFLAECAARAAS